MKTPFITLIATIALTHATYAGDWMWFHGDIRLVTAPIVAFFAGELDEVKA
jgi:hypothetical protein